MSNTIPAQIMARLRDPKSFKALDTSGSKFKLTLDNEKSYLVTYSDSGIEVERSYKSKTFLDRLRILVAEFFGRSNRQFIRSALKQDPQLWDILEPVRVPKPDISELKRRANQSVRERSSGFTVARKSSQPATEPQESSQPAAESQESNQPATESEEFSQKLQEFSQKVAAKKLQKHARRFLARKNLSCMLAERVGSTDGYNRFCMTHPRRKDYLGNPLKYYFDKDGIAPAVRRPMGKKSECSVDESIKGAEKQLTAKEKNFVELVSLKKRGFSKRKSRKFIEIARHLAPYSSCRSGVQIDGRTLLAQSGGKDMKAMMKAHPDGGYRINDFKQSCADLKNMHQRHIFLRDIKAENMTVRTLNSGTKQVMFIDTDEAAVPTLNNYAEKSYTASMTTQGIIEGQMRGDLSVIRAGDNYAKLLLMTEATHRIFRGYPKLDGPGVVDEDGVWHHTGSYQIFRDTKLTAQNYSSYKDWVDEYIKPEYRTSVMRFLLNPAKNQLDAELFDVIDWDRANASALPHPTQASGEKS